MLDFECLPNRETPEHAKELLQTNDDDVKKELTFGRKKEPSQEGDKADSRAVDKESLLKSEISFQPIVL